MATFAEFSQVSLGYGGRPILEGLNFSLERGKYIGLVGSNGVGKSTLLKGLVGALKPVIGQIKFFDRSSQEQRRLEGLGYMPQHQTLETSFPLSVFDTVLMGRYAQMGYRFRPSSEDRQAVKEALEQVNLADRSDAHISALSGGQLQRVLMARALVSKPQVLLLDEPTNGMDLGASQDTLEIVSRLHQQGMTVVIVTHMLEIVAEHAQIVGIFHADSNGRRTVSWGEPKEIFTSQYLSKLFGRPIHWNK
ncbi:MAG: metal ABC transporter ATP-binding protein [Candidatus Bruticola sp.]